MRIHNPKTNATLAEPPSRQNLKPPVLPAFEPQSTERDGLEKDRRGPQGASSLLFTHAGARTVWAPARALSNDNPTNPLTARAGAPKPGW